jgi:hypothetical protein
MPTVRIRDGLSSVKHIVAENSVLLSWHVQWPIVRISDGLFSIKHNITSGGSAILSTGCRYETRLCDVQAINMDPIPQKR